MILKKLLKLICLCLLVNNYSLAENSSFLKCTPKGLSKIPFQIMIQDNSLTIRMKDNEHQLSLSEKYIDPNGELNFLYQNDLLTVVRSKVGTCVFTNQTFSKKNMITCGNCI